MAFGIRMRTVLWVLVLGASMTLPAPGGAAPAPSKATKTKTSATKSARGEGNDADEANEHDDSEKAATSRPAAEANPDDSRPSDPELGAPPVTDESDPGTRPSPLTPRPEEMPNRSEGKPPADYSALMADLTALRARVAALTSNLYDSKLRVTLELEDDVTRIERLLVTVDGGVVFTGPAQFSAEDRRVVYEHAVAPGQHVVGIEVERYDGQSKTYRAFQDNRFSVDVPEEQVLEARIELEAESSMNEFAEAREGTYEIRARLDVEVVEP